MVFQLCTSASLAGTANLKYNFHYANEPSRGVGMLVHSSDNKQEPCGTWKILLIQYPPGDSVNYAQYSKCGYIRDLYQGITILPVLFLIPLLVINCMGFAFLKSPLYTELTFSASYLPRSRDLGLAPSNSDCINAFVKSGGFCWSEGTQNAGALGGCYIALDVYMCYLHNECEASV